MTNQRIDEIYRDTLGALSNLQLPYQLWQHEAILDFKTDLKVAQRLGWTGTHTKSLFLKLKGGGYAIYLTDKDSRIESKALKQVLGKRVSICSDEEMIAQLGCIPGAVCPFAIPHHVNLVVDSRLYHHLELLFTPGRPTETLAISGTSLQTLLNNAANPVLTL